MESKSCKGFVGVFALILVLFSSCEDSAKGQDAGRNLMLNCFMTEIDKWDFTRLDSVHVGVLQDGEVYLDLNLNRVVYIPLIGEFSRAYISKWW